MPIDYRRVLDGLSSAAAMSTEGVAGLAAVDVVVAAAREATGAVGATVIDFRRDGARVVVTSGELGWALGQPVSNYLPDTRQVARPWGGPVECLVPELAERLLGRGVLRVIGHPIHLQRRVAGAVHLYLGEVDEETWHQLGAVLRVVAAAISKIFDDSEPSVQASASASGGGGSTRSAAEEDDRTLFLAVAGHELRTPVTVVKGYASMLADRWESLGENNRRDAARVLSQRADDLARLVDRLLGASMGDGSGWLVRNVPFDLLEGLVHAAGDLSAELRRSLRLELPTSLPLASGDPTVLTSIVAELVTNAVRSSARAGVWSGNGSETAGVEIQAGADAHTVFIRVCDRGIGIDPTDVDRAFDRFWRARREGEGRGGVGLGLYLVRQLVERQKGWVSLRPRDGGGTVAEVRFRRADGSLRPSAAGEA